MGLWDAGWARGSGGGGGQGRVWRSSHPINSAEVTFFDQNWPYWSEWPMLIKVGHFGQNGQWRTKPVKSVGWARNNGWRSDAYADRTHWAAPRWTSQNPESTTGDREIVPCPILQNESNLGKPDGFGPMCRILRRLAVLVQCAHF